MWRLLIHIIIVTTKVYTSRFYLNIQQLNCWQSPSNDTTTKPTNPTPNHNKSSQPKQAELYKTQTEAQ